jgi:hypothetical protein
LFGFYCCLISALSFPSQQSLLSKNAASVQSQFPSFSTWCDEWKVSALERRTLFQKTYELFYDQKLHLEAFAAIKLALEIDVAVDAVGTELAKKAVVLALSLPSEYVLDNLAALTPVQALASGDHQALHQLLTIMVSGTVPDFEAFVKKNAGFFGTHPELSESDLLSKIRLLSLTSAAENTNVLPYDQAAAALGVQESELESWIIRAISQVGDFF